MYIDRRGILNIKQLTDDRILITLCHDDVKAFNLDFDTIAMSDPHQNKIILRLLQLALSTTGLDSKNKTVVLEALQNNDDLLILVSLSKKTKRKKYRIKRVTQYPCYRFDNCEHMLTAIKKLYNTDALFYNNSAFCYKNRYYLVFDYPFVSKKAKSILSEYSSTVRGVKPFIARLNECGKKLSGGNAVIHIGCSL